MNYKQKAFMIIDDKRFMINHLMIIFAETFAETM
jgi:hypothetical protein